MAQLRLTVPNLVLVCLIAAIIGTRSDDDSIQLHGSRRTLQASEAVCMQAQATHPVPDYTWMSDEATRQLAQVNPGNRARLRAAMQRYLSGGNLTVVFIGGSIAAGQGAFDGQAFPTWAELILHGALGIAATDTGGGNGGGGRVRVHNGAVPGTLSSYMSVCHNVHVPAEADVVILDYTINDPDNVNPPFDNAIRRPFERLLRKLLTYPKCVSHPAAPVLPGRVMPFPLPPRCVFIPGRFSLLPPRCSWLPVPPPQVSQICPVPRAPGSNPLSPSNIPGPQASGCDTDPRLLPLIPPDPQAPGCDPDPCVPLDARRDGHPRALVAGLRGAVPRVCNVLRASGAERQGGGVEPDEDG